MSDKYILSLDQGTTSSRALLIDHNGTVVDSCQKEFKQIFPKEGWVEHDPFDILNSQLDVAKELMEKQGISSTQIDSIGITNQRETTIVWDKNSGKPIYNAIVWQCRRTADICSRIIEDGKSELVHRKSGLKIDSYFSATKISWILSNVEGAREKADNGELLFGTVDCWLLWNLTNGKVHATDRTNASRTMLYNINSLEWDKELLDLFSVPENMLPEVFPSSNNFGLTDNSVFGSNIPICSLAGDQQSAMFGQFCIKEGMIKNTYGTGCFIMLNSGKKPYFSQDGLLTTLLCSADGSVKYGLEGSVFMGGATIQWLRDNLRIVETAQECDREAEKVENNGGVYLVSAFQGLGSPYWDMDARAAIIGLTRMADRRHICRAAIESIAYRSNEVIDVMRKNSGLEIAEIRVDGGASNSNILMQFQSNISGLDVIRPEQIETTAMGAAYLAGLKSGFWKSLESLKSKWNIQHCFKPDINEKLKNKLLQGWMNAVKKSRLR